MNTILDILYDAFRSDTLSSEEQVILKREEAFLDEIERRLGIDDFARFWDAASDLGCRRAEQNFQLGFWLGANLVLAAASFPQN